MPRVSILPINPQTKGYVEKSFPLLVTMLEDRRETQDFFDNFLTDEEKTMFGKRLMLYVFLEKGFPANRIQSLLGVSFETVRVHRSKLKKFDERTENFIQRLAEQVV